MIGVDTFAWTLQIFASMTYKKATWAVDILRLALPDFYLIPCIFGFFFLRNSIDN